jgi:hypothetical protein
MSIYARTNQGDSEPTDGFGMGEGEGQKNVSDEIEDEEQLVGADQQGKEKEEQQQNKPKGERDKNEASVEMQQVGSRGGGDVRNDGNSDIHCCIIRASIRHIDMVVQCRPMH